MKFYELMYDDDNYGDALKVGHDELFIAACPKEELKNRGFIFKKREGEKGNLIIDLPSLKKMGDFITTFGYTAWMITDEVSQLFKEQGFTGYELRPVKVNKVKRMKEGSSIPKLWQLVITGWGGIAPPESGMKLISECKVCGYKKRYSGLSNPSALINPSQWDGSDFFIIYPLVRFIFVTERVKQFIEKKKLRGCLFREPKDIKPIDSEIGIAPLSLYMPLDRAKEIGEPLGIYWEPPQKGTEKYRVMREALLEIFREEYTSRARKGIVYFEDEDGYIIEW